MDNNASDIASAFELPDIIRIDDNLTAVSFRLMKLLPAREIITEALRAGSITATTTVVETTSGTFGLGLAMICAQLKIPLHLVSDPAIEPGLQRRLADLGAVLHVVQAPSTEGGYQQARLNRVVELTDELEDTFVPSQYANPANPLSYARVAAQIIETVGKFDCLVGAVGSGGSTSGIGKYLRTVLPNLTVVAVDTPGSVLFGKEDRPRLLRGLGNSLMPQNLDHTTYNDVHWIPAADAFTATRQLHREHAVFAGPTSGAAFKVAKWYAAKGPQQQIVAIFPDAGDRYIDTIYNDVWVADKLGESIGDIRDSPRRAEIAEDGGQDWHYFSWNRRAAVHVSSPTKTEGVPA